MTPYRFAPADTPQQESDAQIVCLGEPASGNEVRVAKRREDRRSALEAKNILKSSVFCLPGNCHKQTCFAGLVQKSWKFHVFYSFTASNNISWPLQEGFSFLKILTSARCFTHRLLYQAVFFIFEGTIVTILTRLFVWVPPKNDPDCWGQAPQRGSSLWSLWPRKPSNQLCDVDRRLFFFFFGGGRWVGFWEMFFFFEDGLVLGLLGLVKWFSRAVF